MHELYQRRSLVRVDDTHMTPASYTRLLPSSTFHVEGICAVPPPPDQIVMGPDLPTVPLVPKNNVKQSRPQYQVGNSRCWCDKTLQNALCACLCALLCSDP